ncbi:MULTISPECIES: hypothetical protein [unclassified Maridesulfovibrio]|uniref:hypothetical protein n=1 Tax=unclassified Maridesulfovibrio TaxID=2794999 RepID=UPI003B416B9C
MNKDQVPERKRIKGYNYEIDENGAVFSLSKQNGYGVGRQIKPVKVSACKRPAYTLHRGSVAKVFVAEELYSHYFDGGPQFNLKWHDRIRQQADIYNVQLRKEYQEARAEGRDMTPVTPAPIEQPRKSKALSKGWLKFWIEGEASYRVGRCAAYTEFTGLNAFDPQVCPLR